MSIHAPRKVISVPLRKELGTEETYERLANCGAGKVFLNWLKTLHRTLEKPRTRREKTFWRRLSESEKARIQEARDMQSFFFKLPCGDEQHIVFVDTRPWPRNHPRLIPINHQSELDDPSVMKALQALPEQLDGCLRFLHKGVNWGWLDKVEKFEVADEDVDSMIQSLIRNGLAGETTCS